MDTATHPTDRPDVPPVIDRYQHAHDRRDTATAIATFTTDATVVDEDRTYVGTTDIRWWLDHAASEYTFTRTLTGTEDLGDGRWIVRNRLEGDFPGGVADLAYRFTLEDDLIAHLEIAP